MLKTKQFHKPQRKKAFGSELRSVMQLLKEHQSFSLSVAIQNSTLIIPYSEKFVQEF